MNEKLVKELIRATRLMRHLQKRYSTDRTTTNLIAVDFQESVVDSLLDQFSQGVLF